MYALLVAINSERLAAYREMHNAAAFENLGLFYDPFSATYAYYPGQVAKGMDDISLRHSEILLLASSNEVRETANLIHSEAFVLRTKLMSRRYRADPSVNQKLSNWVRRKESPDGNWVRREASRLEGAAVEFVQAVRKEQGMEDW